MISDKCFFRASYASTETCQKRFGQNLPKTTGYMLDSSTQNHVFMSDTFSVFRKYPSEEDAAGLTEWLEANRIEYCMEKTAPSFNVTFTEASFKDEVVIKLKTTDFERVNEALTQSAVEALETVDESHYLFDFTDQELTEIILKPNEWNPFDYQLAQKILKERGKEVNAELVATIRDVRIQEMAKKDEPPTVWIWAGYTLAFLGGFFGFFIGWHLAAHTKSLPDGTKTYAYIENVRRHGKIIMIVGAIFIVLGIFIRLRLFAV
jgi:hypothetical protein